MSPASPRVLTPGSAIVGFVGLGRMGRPMCARLAEAGFELVVHDADQAAVEGTCAATGAAGADDLASLGRDADVVITMLPSSRVTQDVVLGAGPDAPGLLAGMRPGTLLLDMGSSDPNDTLRIAERAADADVLAVDAPVSGGVQGASGGSLTVMVGGAAAVVDRIRPLLEALGSRLIPTGPVGSAHAMKALNNLLSATGMLATGEALLVGRRFGLDPATMLDVLNASSGRSYATERKFGQFVLSRSFASGFSLELMLKDVTTAVELARSTATPVPLSAACREQWAVAHEQLGSGADHTEIARWLERIAGLELVADEPPGALEGVPQGAQSGPGEDPPLTGPD